MIREIPEIDEFLKMENEWKRVLDRSRMAKSF
jgi:hypothetical protein